VSDEPKRPLDPDFVIDLPAFQGPLDLLLHLIQKHELEILDLPIAFVTDKYLAYLGVIENLNLDIAAEYLLMAATLAHIKSKMLLPPDPNAAADEADSPEDEIDPRAELILRLLEYQKYKAAAEALSARGIAGRDIFFRGTAAVEAQGPAPLADVGLYKLLDAFQRVVDRSKIDFSREINAERITIQERMSEITERISKQRRATFDELFAGLRTSYEIVVTFLALLEMAKMQLLRVYQADSYSPLYLESAVVGEHDEERAARLDGEDPYAYRAYEPAAEPRDDDAQSVASDAESAADDVESVASDAESVADDAERVADDAESAADDAESAADDAESAADDAERVADDAESAADDAESVADDAESVADDAESAADDAESVADDAESAADDAESVADDAESAADDAESAAEPPALDLAEENVHPSPPGTDDAPS